MDQRDIIRDLSTWIDNHLEMPLSLDYVAKKAGYTKWHLQRMFKSITQQSLGSYIRKRRLSKAAIALRLTSKSVLEIALLYHFESQQTFTRAFKRQFGQTPAYYRRADKWDTAGLCPPLLFATPPTLDVEYVNLPNLQLMTIGHQYHCSLDRISSSLVNYRSRAWYEHFTNIAYYPDRLYGIHQIRPSGRINSEQQVTYMAAIEFNHDINLRHKASLTIPANHYAKFHYQGDLLALQDFILMLYTFWLPKFKLVRTSGYDIEIFYPKQQLQQEKKVSVICDYYIPTKS